MTGSAWDTPVNHWHTCLNRKFGQLTNFESTFSGGVLFYSRFNWIFRRLMADSNCVIWNPNGLLNSPERSIKLMKGCNLEK